MKLRRKGRTGTYHKGVMRNDVMLTMTIEARTAALQHAGTPT